jgi:hypothetical protein
MPLGSLWSSIVAAKAAILTGCAVAAVCLPLGYCKGHDAATDKAALSIERATTAALRIVGAANEIAAATRIRDTVRITTQDKDRTDAITAAPQSRTGAATRQLGCVRLRQAGQDRAADAAGCRR